MKKETAQIAAQECIATDIYSMTLRVSFAEEVKPGQFLSVYSADGARLLPRPISICDVDLNEGTVRLVYRIAGKGTAEFSKLTPGCGIDVLGPLGNGFPVEEFRNQRVLLVGGGIGIPPLYYTAKSLSNPVFAVGYRSETYLLPDISGQFETHVATEDGSLGTKGNVLDAIRADGIEADVIFACGPKPMLRALKEYSKDAGIRCFVSMEERMACGVGACLGCVTRTVKQDAHSFVKNARICKDGPVFDAEEVDLT